MTSQALVPRLLVSKSQFKSTLVSEAVSLATGVALIALLAQIAIPLPWTPVPITGQTLGVSLVALSWGRSRAFTIMLVYLLLGALGAPIFAMGRSGMMLGPTFGYLLGMLLASFVVGSLSDRGFTKSFWKTLAASYAGSILTLGTGLLVLSFYLPKEQLLVAGLLPFIPGDIIKNFISATLSWKARTSL